MFNVRSLLQKIEEFRLLLKTAQFDIFCINESWLDDSVISPEMDVIGYSVLSKQPSSSCPILRTHGTHNTNMLKLTKWKNVKYGASI